MLLGLDVGGTKLAAVVADRHGTILSKEKRPTRPERGPSQIVAELVEMLCVVCDDIGTSPFAAQRMGVSFGGPIDWESGVVAPVPNLPGWDGVPLHRELTAAFPGVDVLIENDANAAALAEWRFGAARGKTTVLYMTMGTGIGGGIVLDGRIFRGASGNAGEIGHVCLDPDGPTCGCGRLGCLEAYCSGPSIARRARNKIRAGSDCGDLLSAVDVTELCAEDIVEAARRGNAFANQHIVETARFMAQGIGSAISLLSPDVVILGTVATAAGPLFFDPLRDALPFFTMPQSLEAVEVLPAGLGDAVGDYAAIALVLADR